MLRDVWNRVVRRRREAAIERSAEEARMSPAQRRVAEESLEERQADEFVEEHLGGINPERLLGEDETPRR